MFDQLPPQICPFCEADTVIVEEVTITSYPARIDDDQTVIYQSKPAPHFDDAIDDIKDVDTSEVRLRCTSCHTDYGT